MRAAQNPLAAAQAVRQVVHRLDASVPVYDLKTLDAQIGETHFLDRLLAWLSLAFGFLATLLASIGLCGITSFSVARRRSASAWLSARRAAMSCVSSCGRS